MTTSFDEFALSVETNMGFAQTLQVLRERLPLAGFRVVAEVPFRRECEKNVGLRCKDYTVLVVWSPFHAYQALLSDPNAGLLLPFNLAVAADGDSTVIAALSPNLFGRGGRSLGLQVLARELTRKIRETLVRLAVAEAAPGFSTLTGGQKEVR